jgi:hypothetical protein
MDAMRKHLRICGGFLTLLAGLILALPLVPGPGIPLILVGLVLLSDHFPWAKRVLDWAMRKWRQLRPN